MSVGEEPGANFSLLVALAVWSRWSAKAPAQAAINTSQIQCVFNGSGSRLEHVKGSQMTFVSLNEMGRMSAVNELTFFLA